MTSAISWLDQSIDQQRKVRELVSLFSQRESRDELGLGQIRDVFSEELFPGTSVIQTRARYFLFVPWLFRRRATRHQGADLLRRVQDDERRLIETLRAAGAVDGLIGRQAGVGLKVLPSTIYWYGLGRWGVLTSDVAIDQVGGHGPQGDDGTDELAARAAGDWHPTLPAAPPGFPDEVPGGFALTAKEAGWLTERILSAAPASLLAHLVTASAAPIADTGAPWEEPASAAAPPAAVAWLEHARRFSLAFHGAALLYNLLLAEAYEAAGFDGIEAPVDTYRAELDDWGRRLVLASDDLTGWDRRDLRRRVTERNPRISGRTWAFVETWLDLVVDRRAVDVSNLPSARRLVAERERLQKGRQARLANEKLLAGWSGAAGARAMAYRWGSARRLVADIHEGRELGRAGT